MGIIFSFFLIFFNLILFFKLYIIVLVLPNIKMNPPQERGGFRMGNTCIPVGIIFSINHILKECTYTLKEEKEKRKMADTLYVNSLLYY